MQFHAEGHFTSHLTVSRGPWFKEMMVEEDGLEWYYTFLDSDMNKCYLLSNNVPLQDRERLANIYHSHVRNNQIGWFFGGWTAFELVNKIKYCRTSALGWRAVQWLSMTYLLKQAF